MAIIKPEQLSSGSYNISGSFSGSFAGDGSNLTNLPNQSINTSSLATTGSNTFLGNQIVTGSVTSTTGFTGSLFGTATTASYILNAVSASYSVTASYATNALSASYALTASYVAGASSFPYTGSAEITGSLTVTGSIYTNSTIYSPFIISINFETITSYTYKAPYALKIDSVESNPSSSITLSYVPSGSVSSSNYVFGATINKFDSLTVIPLTSSLVILNSVRI